MLKRMLFTVPALTLCAAFAQTQTTYSGKMAGIYAGANSWWQASFSNVVVVDIHPEVVPLDANGNPTAQAPGFAVSYLRCVDVCVSVQGFLPQSTTAITWSPGSNSLTVNIDISMLQNASVTAYCMGANCPSNHVFVPPTSWPLTGTFTATPSNLPETSQTTTVGQTKSRQVWYSGITVSETFSGTRTDIGATFVGQVGDPTNNSYYTFSGTVGPQQSALSIKKGMDKVTYTVPN